MSSRIKVAKQPVALFRWRDHHARKISWRLFVRVKYRKKSLLPPHELRAQDFAARPVDVLLLPGVAVSFHDAGCRGHGAGHGLSVVTRLLLCEAGGHQLQRQLPRISVRTERGKVWLVGVWCAVLSSEFFL